VPATRFRVSALQHLVLGVQVQDFAAQPGAAEVREQ
jgi:hypothetical protein